MRDTTKQKKYCKRKAIAFSIQTVLFHSAAYEPGELGIVPLEQNRKIAHESFPSCKKRVHVHQCLNSPFQIKIIILKTSQSVEINFLLK